MAASINVSIDGGRQESRPSVCSFLIINRSRKCECINESCGLAFVKLFSKSFFFFLDPVCICSSCGPCFQSLRPFWPSRTKETSRSGIILISLGLKLDQVSYPMGTRDKFFVRRFLPSRISPCSFLLLLYLRTPQLNNLKAATAAKIFLGSTGKLFYFFSLSLSLRPMKRNGNIHRTFLFISIFCRFIGIFISQSS